MADTIASVLFGLVLAAFAARAVRDTARLLRQRARIARLQPSTLGSIVLVKAPAAPQAVRREVAHG